ncbi:hypothetical protein LAG90_01955 [Marinilongibacter aquaticus]|uniref:YncE family protein n=1 Tax=Marinilongibacter aquaticus TaxID=2975157 RepID=UPI0021BDD2BF|nr:hypothetical protein [Marinilongibacter aquaticus]UBM59421.1 hypothetical protein LAG90_01955 [Marinilongibacter aquaticus]
MTKRLLFIFSLLLAACSKGDEMPKPQSRTQVAFVVCADDKSVDVIDLQSGAKIDSYSITSESDKFPQRISLSEDKTTLAIANPNYDFSLGHLGLHGKQYAGGVVLMDASNGNILSEFSLPIANYNVLLQDEEVWTALVSHSGRANVYTKSGALKHEMALDADPSNLLFNGNYAVVTSGESTFLQVFDREEKKLVKKVKVDIAPANVWEGYDDKVLITNAYDSSVNIVDLSELRVTDYFDTHFAPEHIVYNALQDEYWLCDKLGDKVRIYKKSEGSWAETQSIDFADKQPFMLAFFDMGKTAFLVNQKGNEVVFIDTNSKEIIRRTPIGAKPSGLALSE